MAQLSRVLSALAALALAAALVAAGVDARRVRMPDPADPLSSLGPVDNVASAAPVVLRAQGEGLPGHQASQSSHDRRAVGDLTFHNVRARPATAVPSAGRTLL